MANTHETSINCLIVILKTALKEKQSRKDKSHLSQLVAVCVSLNCDCC